MGCGGVGGVRFQVPRDDVDDDGVEKVSGAPEVLPAGRENLGVTASPLPCTGEGGGACECAPRNDKGRCVQW